MDFSNVFFDTEDYEITERVIGKGVFGTVNIAERLSDHKLCAAKLINILNDIDGKTQMMIMRESFILSKLNHKSIIKFYGLNFRSLKDMLKFQPTIITEYMPNESLKKVLHNERNGLADHKWSPTKKYICLLGISDAMRYLHEHNIIHRDLKPENILMDENYYPVVCDFGLSRCFPNLLSSSMKMSLTGHIGTPLYMAPELFEDDDEVNYGKKVDVYAFAILAYEIITGKEPFKNEKSQLSLWNKISNGERPKFTDDIPEKMKDLISKCWSQKAKDRPSFREIFQMLSNDFTYSPEDIDEDEVNLFLESIENSSKDDKKMILNKCLEIEKEQLQKEIDLNQILHYACKTNNVKILEYILSCDSIDINSKLINDDNEKTALHIAVEKENDEIVKLLLSHPKIDVNMLCKEKADQGELIQNGIKGTEPKLESQFTALHIAVEKENDKIVKLLLSHPKIDVNIVSKETKNEKIEDSYTLSYYEKTALHIAVEKENDEIVKTLLSHPKIDVNMLCKEKADQGELIQNGTKGTEPKLESQFTALHIAVEKENDKIVKTLLSHPKIDVNIFKHNYYDMNLNNQNGKGKYNQIDQITALTLAIEKENMKIVELLLSNSKIDVNLFVKNETNIYFYFEHLGKEKIVNGEEKTALHTAIEKNNLNIVNMLLENKNIDINLYLKDFKDKKEKSVLQLAFESENMKIIELLMSRKEINITSLDKQNYNEFMSLIDKRMKKLSLQINDQT